MVQGDGMRLIKNISLIILLTILQIPVEAATLYIRTDGGNTGTCDGTLNVPAAGSSGGHCAWKHPFDALPPGGTARISGGDTLIIGDGSYRMGYTAGVYSTGACSSSWPYDCVNSAIPSGSPDNPTRILGENWNIGCTEKPELYGVEKENSVLRTGGNDHIEMQCLNITDHDDCILSHSGGLACPSSFPFGDWAKQGINASGTDNLTLKNLDVHGFAHVGIYVDSKGGSNWLVENTTIQYNGWAGLDGQNFSGNMTFRRLDVSWNGCSDSYPSNTASGCWGQTAGGYGDGVGLDDSIGSWIIEDSKFFHNTSDGLDMLYLLPAASVTLDRIHSEGNAGNQVKVAGGSKKVINSVLVGNCGFFGGKPFTYNVDNCRALGHPLALAFSPSSTATVINTSIYGEGDGIFLVAQRDGVCTGAEALYMRNVLVHGDRDYNAGVEENSAYIWNECAGLTVDHDYEKVYNLKNGMTIMGSAFTDIRGSNSDYATPGFIAMDKVNEVFDLALTESSTAVNTGMDSGGTINGVNIPSIDFLGRSRSDVDMGAYEYGVFNTLKILTGTGRHTFGGGRYTRQ